MRILVTGGVKSGKSRRALELSSDFAGQKFFLATATPFDDEMKTRIARHKEERALLSFITLEEPVHIDKAVRDAMILDCIPMWLNNIFFTMDESAWEPILSRFIQKLPPHIIIVTNEIGMGIIPADALSRRYGIALGTINARLAAACDSVELVIAGIPVRIK